MGSQNNRVKSFLEAHLLTFQASSELSVTAWAPTGRPAQKPGCIVNHPLRCVITPCHQLLEATSAVTKDSPRCLTFQRGSSTSGWGRSPEMRSIKESLLEKVFCVTIHPTPFWGFPGTSGWKKKKKICLPMQEIQEIWVQSLGQKMASLGVGNGNPLQYSCLDNPTDRGAWWATVHGITKSQTRLSN